MGRFRSLEDWAKSARAQVGTFAHGRGNAGSIPYVARQRVRELEEVMLRRRGAETVAAALLLLVWGANYLRGRAALRRRKKGGAGYVILGKRPGRGNGRNFRAAKRPLRRG